MNFWEAMEVAERVGKIIIKVAIYGAIAIIIALAAIIKAIFGVR